MDRSHQDVCCIASPAPDLKAVLRPIHAHFLRRVSIDAGAQRRIDLFREGRRDARRLQKDARFESSGRDGKPVEQAGVLGCLDTIPPCADNVCAVPRVEDAPRGVRSETEP